MNSDILQRNIAAEIVSLANPGGDRYRESPMLEALLTVIAGKVSQIAVQHVNDRWQELESRRREAERCTSTLDGRRCNGKAGHDRQHHTQFLSSEFWDDAPVERSETTGSASERGSEVSTPDTTTSPVTSK